MQKSEWLERMAAQQRRFEDLQLEGLAKWTNMMAKFIGENCPDGEICTATSSGDEEVPPTWPLPMLEGMPDNLTEIGATIKDMNEFYVGTLAHMEEMEKREAATKEAGQ